MSTFANTHNESRRHMTPDLPGSSVSLHSKLLVSLLQQPIRAYNRFVLHASGRNSHVSSRDSSNQGRSNRSIILNACVGLSQGCTSGVHDMFYLRPISWEFGKLRQCARRQICSVCSRKLLPANIIAAGIGQNATSVGEELLCCRGEKCRIA